MSRVSHYVCLDAKPDACLSERVTRTVEADYLVVGAGATGLAFTDALIDHADARVVVVDRRDGVGGHWRDAYPFVRLHQASAFYGVASTVLGGAIQQDGPEAGLHERALRDEICDYYDKIVDGRIDVRTRSEYAGDRTFRSLDSGEVFAVPAHCRVVDATYLSPQIPALTPPPFEVGDGARVVAVNDLPRVEDEPSEYVVVGSGKTATDAIIWLLGRGTDPGDICWVRPRDPWMLNRAVVQPDPETFLGMAADVMESAAAAESLEDLFLRLEDAGVMLRIDRGVTPTMARTPTLATWELDLLRTVERVVRLGHVRRVEPGRLVLADGTVPVADDALVVHCAAYGLPQPPRVPIWQDAITLQPVRAGFPCFGAALIGYVEATRSEDAEKNRACPPSSYGNSLADWATMNVTGTHASLAFAAEPDIKAWSDTTPLNPARIPPGHSSPQLGEVLGRLRTHGAPGLLRLTELSRP